MGKRGAFKKMKAPLTLFKTMIVLTLEKLIAQLLDPLADLRAFDVRHYKFAFFLRSISPNKTWLRFSSNWLMLWSPTSFLMLSINF